MLRIMGKREVGQLGVLDLIVSLLIAELAAISIENLNSSIFIVAVSIFGLTLLEVIVDYLSIKSSKVRRYLEGEPVFIIKNGKVNYKEMVKERYGISSSMVILT